MTQVIKVSKQGVNVGTATNPNDLIFDSTLNTFKILSVGTKTASFGSNDSVQYTNTAHGQSGVPFVFGFAKYNENYICIPGEKAYSIDSWFTDMYVDGTNINFGVYYAAAGSQTITFKYIICEPTF